MASFEYIGKDTNGKSIKGHQNAPNSAELYQRLKREGIYAYHIEEKDNINIYKLTIKELSDFSSQLSSMLTSGISVIKALSILEQQTHKAKLKSVYNRMGTLIRRGNTLTQAMEVTEAFSDFIIDMYKVGEKSGNLEHTTKRAAEYYEKEYRITGKIKSALMYPVFLGLVTTGITIFIFTFILPQFEEMLSGVELETITKIMMAISYSMLNYGIYWSLGVVLLIAAIYYFCKRPSIAYKISKIQIGVPLVDKLLITIYTARFARTLSILYGSGVSMVEAAEAGGRAIGNMYLSSLFESVVRKIRQGNTLSKAMDELKIPLHPKLIIAISTGEQTGRLGEILDATADGLDYDADMAIKGLLTLIEPIMIVLMAIIIGTVMISVMLPLMGIYQGVG